MLGCFSILNRWKNSCRLCLCFRLWTLFVPHEAMLTGNMKNSRTQRLTYAPDGSFRTLETVLAGLGQPCRLVQSRSSLAMQFKLRAICECETLVPTGNGAWCGRVAIVPWQSHRVWWRILLERSKVYDTRYRLLRGPIRSSM